MASVNKIILMGRLGQDPLLKTTKTGVSVCKFSIATTEKWKDSKGEYTERTEWHNIVVWGKPAENCAKYLQKGAQVYLEGKLQSGSWDDAEGKKHFKTEIIANEVQFLTPKDHNPNITITPGMPKAKFHSGYAKHQTGPRAIPEEGPPAINESEEIPF